MMVIITMVRQPRLGARAREFRLEYYGNAINALSVRTIKEQ